MQLKIKRSILIRARNANFFATNLAVFNRLRLGIEFMRANWISLNVFKFIDVLHAILGRPDEFEVRLNLLLIVLLNNICSRVPKYYYNLAE